MLWLWLAFIPGMSHDRQGSSSSSWARLRLPLQDEMLPPVMMRELFQAVEAAHLTPCTWVEFEHAHHMDAHIVAQQVRLDLSWQKLTRWPVAGQASLQLLACLWICQLACSKAVMPCLQCLGAKAGTRERWRPCLQSAAPNLSTCRLCISS